MSMFGGSTNPTGASFTGYQPSFVHPSSYVPSGVGSQPYWQPSSYPGNTNDTWLKVSEMVTGDKSGVTSQSQTSQQINNLSDVLTPIDPKTGKPFSTETSKRGFWGRLSDAVRGKTTTAPTDAETQQRFDNSATTVGQAKRLAMDAVRDYQQSMMHNQQSSNGPQYVSMPDGSIRMVPMNSGNSDTIASLAAIPSVLPPMPQPTTSQATQSTIQPSMSAGMMTGANSNVSPSTRTSTATMGDKSIRIEQDEKTGYSHCEIDLRAIPSEAYTGGRTMETAARDANGNIIKVFTFRVVDSTNGHNGITFLNNSMAGSSGALGSQTISGAPGTSMLPKRWEGPKRSRYGMYDFWHKTAAEGKRPYNVIDQLVHTEGAAGWATLGGSTADGAQRISYAESLLPHVRTEFGLENDPGTLRKLCCWGGELLNEGEDLPTVGASIKDFAKTLYGIDPLTEEQKTARRSVYGPAMSNPLSGTGFLSSNMDLSGKHPIEISRMLTSDFYTKQPDKSTFFEITDKDRIADFRKQGHDHWARLGKSAHEMSHADWISANVRTQAAKHFDDSMISRYDIPNTPLAEDQRFLLSTQKTDQSLLNPNMDDATLQSLVDQEAKKYGWREKSTGGFGSYFSGVGSNLASGMSTAAKVAGGLNALRTGYNLFFG